MFKKFRPFIAITLLVQSISMIVLFFMLYNKKRSLANTFLALAAVGGAIGGIMFWQEYGEALGLKAAKDDDEDIFNFDDLELDLDDEMLSAELSRDEDIGFYDEAEDAE